MLFALVALLFALGIGFVSGGSLDQLGSLRFRRSWLVLIAVLAQFTGAVVGGPWYPSGLILSALVVLGFLVLNRGVRGSGLVTLGLLLNALVVGVNGAMPVSADALGTAGISTQDLLQGNDPRHQLADGGTRLQLLGDVIPVLLPAHPEVVSAGDVLVAAGLAQLVVVAMRRRPQ